MPVFLKAALAASLLIPLTSASQDYPGERTVSYPRVRQVWCDRVAGTAFRVGKGFVSATHVTSNSGCKVDGKALTVTHDESGLDVTEFNAPSKQGVFKINCDGFIPGRWYYAIGFARGAPFQTMVTVYATYLTWPSNGERVLVGPVTFIPGMSGGPVLNAQGEVVGVVNMLVNGTAISLSREMRETSLCS